MSEPEGDPRVLLAQRRTQMAALRTSQALDRTTLAWIRTTLTMNSFGLGIIAFFRTRRMENETPATVLLHERAIFFERRLLSSVSSPPSWSSCCI
ncbi:DUF202 domain-containing protein [Edaphobacter aggregans]|uniref:DUF202 domain-containing protein n=1 Tax=Edaphobacter aggregans TaxID=570835 RepID=UPI000552FC49|nr:DUF202 domain-containing protein [Edaphobacter aggregans]